MSMPLTLSDFWYYLTWKHCKALFCPAQFIVLNCSFDLPSPYFHHFCPQAKPIQWFDGQIWTIQVSFVPLSILACVQFCNAISSIYAICTQFFRSQICHFYDICVWPIGCKYKLLASIFTALSCATCQSDLVRSIWSGNKIQKIQIQIQGYLWVQIQAHL